ncbi:MAG: hypothetical protein M1820_002119 [Bogoriella megaspora]|nr:MAG: hypothetical protein M1820_002119 [Bogoriella megaspora]
MLDWTDYDADSFRNNKRYRRDDDGDDDDDANDHSSNGDADDTDDDDDDRGGGGASSRAARIESRKRSRNTHESSCNYSRKTGISTAELCSSDVVSDGCQWSTPRNARDWSFNAVPSKPHPHDRSRSAEILYRSDSRLELPIRESRVSQELRPAQVFTEPSLTANSTRHIKPGHLEELELNPTERQDNCIDQNLSNWLPKIPKPRDTLTSEEYILKSLCFNTMDERSDRIQPAHAKAFEWIFDDSSAEDETSGVQNEVDKARGRPSKANFSEWLGSGKQTYWVSGKPGSGKSTLMNRLERWAGGQDVFIGSYYFWQAGTRIQNSLEGLIRAILHQLLRHRPDFIAGSFPNIWRESKEKPATDLTSIELPRLSMQDLLTAFKSACRLLEQSRCKICLFIDGLDECRGEPSQVVQLISSLIHDSNVRICVSSRPLPAFRNLYGEHNPWKLYLNDLNRDDIAFYVRDNLEQYSRAMECWQQDNKSATSKLVGNMVVRAQGTFLWAILAIRHLSDGFENDEGMMDLQQRLEILPTDLESLFEFLLESIEPVYYRQAALFFRATFLAHGNLSPTTYAWIAEDSSQPCSFNRALVHKSLSQRKLATSCKGLLEIYQPPDYNYRLIEAPRHQRGQDIHTAVGPFRLKVNFLHRTVRDLILTNRLLENWAPNDDINPAIYRGILEHVASISLDMPYLKPSGPGTRLENDQSIKDKIKYLTEMESILNKLEEQATGTKKAAKLTLPAVSADLKADYLGDVPDSMLNDGKVSSQQNHRNATQRSERKQKWWHFQRIWSKRKGWLASVLR